MSALPASTSDRMEIDDEQAHQYARHRPTITSGACRDKIAEAMLEFRQYNRAEMIEILADLDDFHVLKPVYEAQVCSLLHKYAVVRNRDQELEWAEKMKIACNNVIYKEQLPHGGNAWQYFHDLEIEADDYLEIWETQQKEIDEQDALDQHDHDVESIMSGENVAARRAAVEWKSKQRFTRLLKKVQDSQEIFYHTYEGPAKEDLHQFDPDAIESSLQAKVESDDEELSDAKALDEEEPGAMSAEEQFEDDKDELPALGDEQQTISDQLGIFLRDENLLPYFKTFIRNLERKQTRNLRSTAARKKTSKAIFKEDEDLVVDGGGTHTRKTDEGGEADTTHTRGKHQTAALRHPKQNEVANAPKVDLVRIADGVFKVVGGSEKENHDEEEAEEDEGEDTDGIDAARRKKRKYPDHDEIVEKAGGTWQMGEEMVLTQRPKNQRMDSGL